MKIAAFENGPAEGVELTLERLPRYLRVVMSHMGRTDALDLPTDEPRNNETCCAYRRTGDFYHIDFRKRRAGAWVHKYRAVIEQPPQEVMRDRARWEAWCREKEGFIEQIQEEARDG